MGSGADLFALTTRWLQSTSIELLIVRGLRVPELEMQRGLRVPELEMQRGLRVPELEMQRGHRDPEPAMQRGLRDPEPENAAWAAGPANPENSVLGTGAGPP